MNEFDFIAKYDCKLPYNNFTECQRIIREASIISPNAAFMILEEIARPPRMATIKLADQVKLIEYWRDNVVHPLASLSIHAAFCLINHEFMLKNEIVSYLGQVSQYPNTYCALNLVYFASSELDEPEIRQKIEAIKLEWSRLQGK